LLCLCSLSVRLDAAATMLCMVFGPHILVLGRGFGELPNKRKGYSFPLLAQLLEAKLLKCYTKSICNHS